jgi:hypothetical protein
MVELLGDKHYNPTAMPQKPHARRKQKQRRRRKLAEWRRKQEDKQPTQAPAEKKQ